MIKARFRIKLNHSSCLVSRVVLFFFILSLVINFAQGSNIIKMHEQPAQVSPEILKKIFAHNCKYNRFKIKWNICMNISTIFQPKNYSKKIIEDNANQPTNA
jgi:hypothetical protein